MESVYDLYDEIRIAFPDSFEDVDQRHIKQWGSLSADYTYSWFESLANALNHDMSRKVQSERYSKVVSFMATALQNASKEVYDCIDVSFVENLFWQVPALKAESYWNELPEKLKELYIAFHRRTPLH
jgi:hypothetical protein